MCLPFSGLSLANKATDGGVKNLARKGVFGLTGLAVAGKKKKADDPASRPVGSSSTF